MTCVVSLTKRNSYIELCRFIACYCVFSIHTGGRFVRGWIFVEYFFFLSGFFLTKHLEENLDRVNQVIDYPMVYTMNRIKKLLPYTTISILAIYVVNVVSAKLSIKQAVSYFFYLPINILLLNGTGIMPVGVMISNSLETPVMIGSWLWYIAAMAAAMPIAVYLLLTVRKRMRLWLVTFFPLSIYGLLIMCDGTITGWHDGLYTFFALDCRALAGILLGGVVYRASIEIRTNKRYIFNCKGLMTFIEVLSFVLVVYLATSVSRSYESTQIILMVISLSLSLSGCTWTKNLDSSVFRYLGRISLPFYCIHLVVWNIMIWLFPDYIGDMLRGITFCIVLVISIILSEGVGYIEMVLKRNESSET